MSQASGDVAYSPRAGRYPLFRSTISAVGEVVWGYEDRAARIWFFHSIFWFMVVTGFGLTIATELIAPDIFARHTVAGLQPGAADARQRRDLRLAVHGRLRALIFYILPRLLGVRKMWNEGLAYWTAWVWSFAYLFGIFGLANGWTIRQGVLGVHLAGGRAVDVRLALQRPEHRHDDALPPGQGRSTSPPGGRSPAPSGCRRTTSWPTTCGVRATCWATASPARR